MNTDNPKGKLADKQRASAEEILAAAAKAFAERGYAATSIDDVADVLGSTKGRIYHYYRSKGELFFRIHMQAIEWALEAVEPTANSPFLSPSAKLNEMVRRHVMHMIERVDFMAPAQLHTEMNLAREGRNQDADTGIVFDLRRRFEMCYQDVIKAGIEAGEFRDVDPVLMTRAVLGTVNWMTVWYHPGTSPDAFDDERIAIELADYALRGLLVGSTAR